MIKSLPTQIFTVAKSRTRRRNLRVLARFMLVLLGLIALYSVLFHVLMLREGQEHSWITGVYWTLTVMSTLGFGDITFHTDLGRLFSLLVLASGMVFLLVLLPFTFIEFFYEPWVAQQTAARTPRRVSEDTSGHVILTNHDVVTKALIRRLDSFRIPHVTVVSDVEEALRLQDAGVPIAVGELDDPETYRRVRAADAAMVLTTASDVVNTSVAFTVREVCPDLPIVATVHSGDSVDILQLAGCNHVLRLDEMVGQWFARRTATGESSAHVIAHMDGILVAEASVHGTPLIGKTLAESGLRQRIGVTVVGVWERGAFSAARPDTVIQANTVLVLVGSKETLARYDEQFESIERPVAPILILGGGRVGRATARALGKMGHDYRVVEKEASRVRRSERYVHGDAADLAVLKRAGIEDTQTVIITTHDDDVNVYLTLYCRRLRPEVQIIARASGERHVSTLHRAGADFVMSYASTGAAAALNLLKHSTTVMVAEGLDFFRVPIPATLAGRTIADSGIRERTGCSVVAMGKNGAMKVSPGPDEILAEGSEMLLIGTVDAQQRFFARFRSVG